MVPDQTAAEHMGEGRHFRRGKWRAQSHFAAPNAARRAPFRRSPWAQSQVLSDGWLCAQAQPHRALPQYQGEFPDNKRNTGNSGELSLQPEAKGLIPPANSKRCRRDPCAREQGRMFIETGNCSAASVNGLCSTGGPIKPSQFAWASSTRHRLEDSPCAETTVETSGQSHCERRCIGPRFHCR
jgi:hypothetical protein